MLLKKTIVINMDKKIKNTSSTGGPKSDYARDIDFSAYTQSDGYLKGGIDVEVSKENETQEQPVRGQRRMMTDKRTVAKWY